MKAGLNGIQTSKRRPLRCWSVTHDLDQRFQDTHPDISIFSNISTFEHLMKQMKKGKDTFPGSPPAPQYEWS